MFFYLLFILLAISSKFSSPDFLPRAYHGASTIVQSALINGGTILLQGTTVSDYVANSQTAEADTAPTCARSTLTPAIATQAAWDKHFVEPHGNTLPGLNGNHDDFAWTLYYWVRAYVSMAVTYGDTKYLDRAVGSIDHMLAHESSGGGWGAAPLYHQLDTAQVSQAIMSFVYAVYKDPRFASYRPKADTYLTRAENAVRLFDYRWVDHSPILGASFYVYASCGANGRSLCSNSALLMYNQGASMAKALLLMDRVHRMKGMTPPAGYLYKADRAADYFLKFAQPVNGAYLWRYEGGRPGIGYEDTNHGHIDLTFLISARKFNVGGLTDADMVKLAATLKNNILIDQAQSSDVAPDIDGSGLPSTKDFQARNYERVGIGYDWIDLADYDPAVMNKVVDVFNRYMSNFDGPRGALAWAEIQRKNSCTSLY